MFFHLTVADVHALSPFIYDLKHNKHEDYCQRDSNTVTGYNYIHVLVTKKKKKKKKTIFCRLRFSSKKMPDITQKLKSIHTKFLPNASFPQKKMNHSDFRQMVSCLLRSPFENYWEFTVSILNFAS